MQESDLDSSSAILEEIQFWEQCQSSAVPSQRHGEVPKLFRESLTEFLGPSHCYRTLSNCLLLSAAMNRVPMGHLMCCDSRPILTNKTKMTHEIPMMIPHRVSAGVNSSTLHARSFTTPVSGAETFFQFPFEMYETSLKYMFCLLNIIFRKCLNT